VVDLVLLYLRLLLVVEALVVEVVTLPHIHLQVDLDREQLVILEEPIYLHHHLDGEILVEVVIPFKLQITLEVVEEALPLQEQLHLDQLLLEVVEMALLMTLVDHL
jgi:hypothetical protein